MRSDFEKELENLINRYSKENDSNTPDFILARYLNKVLINFNAAVLDREQWYNREKHVEDINDGQLKIPEFDTLSTGSNVIIGDNKGETGDQNQSNVFIGYNNGYTTTGNDSNFIGRPAGKELTEQNMINILVDKGYTVLKEKL